jgi:hypothetical protein
MKLLYFTNDVIVHDSIIKKNNYRKLIHKLKNIELDLRVNSETMCMRELTPAVDDLNNVIEEIKEQLETDNAIYILKKRILL